MCRSTPRSSMRLAQRGFLLKNAEGDPVCVPLGHRAGHESVRQRADAAARKRHRRLHQSAGLRVVARRARGALRRRRGRDQERFRRAGARRRRGVQRRLGPAPAQRLSAALQQVRVRGDAEIPAGRRRCADRVEPRRLGRQPALSDGLGRRSAERLGRPRGLGARRPVVGHERQPVPQLRHRRLLRRGAAVGRTVRALAAGHRVQLAHPRARHRRARALGVRTRGRGHLPQVARVPLPADPVSRVRHRHRHAQRPARDARDAARVSRQPAAARVRDAVHVR